MNTLKIGLVLDDTLDTPDGVQQYVRTIGTWLSAQGHEVHYLVGETTRTDITNMHSLSRNLKVRFNGNRMSTPLPAARSKLRTLLMRERFDVLHIQMPYSPWLAQRIIKSAPTSTAIVGTFHILPYARFSHVANRMLALLLRSSLQKFDEVFAVSEAARTFLKQTYGIDSSVLPNVVDEARFRKAKPLPQYDDDMVTIMFLGRLVPRKGCRTLLEAVTTLLRNNELPPFRVVICGKGPLDVELKQYVTSHSLGDVVSFTGFVPENDKPRFVASADIMTYPSSSGESFGIVLLEAMASGRAVTLGGDNPGYRSVLEPKPELLFKPGDATELAEKLSQYLRNPSARQKVITWQNEYVHQFDIHVVGKKLLAAYEACCRKHVE